MDLSPQSIFIIVIGILICIAGWQLFRISTKIIGFILGASIGYALAVLALAIIKIPVEPSWQPWIPVLSAILMGFFGIFFIKTVVKSILFIAGLFFGIVIFSIFTGVVSGTTYPFGIEMIIENISIWTITSGIVFGVLFIFFEKWFVILYTSAVGAYLIILQTQAPIVIFYGLIAIGTVIQFWMSKGGSVKGLRVAKDSETN